MEGKPPRNDFPRGRTIAYLGPLAGIANAGKCAPNRKEKDEVVVLIPLFLLPVPRFVEVEHLLDLRLAHALAPGVVPAGDEFVAHAGEELLGFG